MESLQALLDKLNKIVFTESKPTHKIVGIVDGNEVEVTMDIKVMTSVHDLRRMPLQAALRVRVNGDYAYGWAASDSEENTTIVKWFIQAESKAYRVEYDSKDDKEAKAKSVIDGL